ncbi:MAG: type I DNA topoisomerase, partial [Deltaproteobacteria bacterium]|nr:type I DNA topoisomerase [Deltaproteobacteria bacterium]
HIKDLPPKSLGVDLKNNFKPEYEIIKGKKKVIDEIKNEASKAEKVFLAPDPDREGEAIAWHLAEEIRRSKKAPPVYRVLFNEITKNAIKQAIANPTELNKNMYEAQQARRILDRLVGYQISPILWDKVRRGLSAGRVQSVAVRLVCDREKEIQEFKTDEYWSLEVKLEGSLPPLFVARLHKKEGKKFIPGNQEEANRVVEEIKPKPFVLKAIEKREQKRNPSPPFITSKLQQEASRKLGFSPKRTMMLAQQLYEGVEVAGGESAGLITYMRTDSTRVASTALDEVRQYINDAYGRDYLPDQPNFYKSKKEAQEAHEAIRPTSMAYTPDVVKKYLKKDEYRLYELIWKRFVASQMKPAVLDRTTFVITAGIYEFRATGSIIKFPGFISVYIEEEDEEAKSPKGEEETDEKGGEGAILPELKEGETLKCLEYLPSQHFTQPPPRFTEASLVKELEEKGIGRPSTYASILGVIQDKKYCEKDEGKRLRPTELGTMVNDLLVKNFTEIMDVQFTARMEEELDQVEEGKMEWVDTLKDFYGTFSKTLSHAKVHMKDIKRQEILTDLKCEKCGSTMVIKFGRHGEFLACQSYPDCKNTKEFRKDESGKIIPEVPKDTGEVCEKCGSPMIVKRGRFGQFLACSAYPKCKTTKAISLGIDCPQCGKPLSARKSKRGRVFYGCTGYPNCTFAAWDKPVNEKCPQCGSNYLVEKYSKGRGLEIRCPEKGCDYRRGVAETSAQPAESAVSS